MGLVFFYLVRLDLLRLDLERRVRIRLDLDDLDCPCVFFFPANMDAKTIPVIPNSPKSIAAEGAQVGCNTVEGVHTNGCPFCWLRWAAIEVHAKDSELCFDLCPSARTQAAMPKRSSTTAFVKWEGRGSKIGAQIFIGGSRRCAV
jgi:hypothetical protein